MLLAVFAFGTVGYMVIEGWGVLDSFWMVIITLTTIGYGEVQPLTAQGRIFTIVLIFSGVSVGTYAMTQLTRAVLEGDLARAYLDSQRRRMMHKLNKHQIVVGYGRLGRIVAGELIDAGHPVAVIERDPAVCEEIAGQGIPVIQGDGADDDCLREVGIERARGIAITAAPVAEAIFVTLSARQLNPTIPILTRVESDEGAVKARRAGATGVVSPHIMGGWRMAHGLTRPHTTTFLDLATLAEHDDIMLDEIEVEEAAGLVDCTLAKLGGRYNHRVLIVAIRRTSGEMVVTPQADTHLYTGDVLIVIGEPERVRLLNKVMRGEGPKA